MADSVVTDEDLVPQLRPRSRYVVHDIARRLPVRARPPVRIEPATELAAITSHERTIVADVVATLRPTFQADGGDVEIVDVVGGTVRVRLAGICADCSAAPLSLAGLQRSLSRALGRHVHVRPIALSRGAEA